MENRRNSSTLTHYHIMGNSNQDKCPGGEIMGEKRSVSVAFAVTSPSQLKSDDALSITKESTLTTVCHHDDLPPRAYAHPKRSS